MRSECPKVGSVISYRKKVICETSGSVALSEILATSPTANKAFLDSLVYMAGGS
jgi:hypothetical protein